MFPVCCLSINSWGNSIIVFDSKNIDLCQKKQHIKHKLIFRLQQISMMWMRINYSGEIGANLGSHPGCKILKKTEILNHSFLLMNDLRAQSCILLPSFNSDLCRGFGNISQRGQHLAYISYSDSFFTHIALKWLMDVDDINNGILFWSPRWNSGFP